MNKIDIKDKKLLYEIELNARLGTSILGNKIGLSQEGVYYRLNRLEKKGLITGYRTFLNFGKIGYTGYAVYCRFQNVTKKQKEKIIEELKQHDHIYWIAGFIGKFDFAFALMAKNIVYFNDMFTEISTKYNDMLKDFTIAIRVEFIQFPRHYLIPIKSPHKQKSRFSGFVEFVNIDNLDKMIIKEITLNARISVLELAKRINHPASTVQFRLKELEREKIIQGYGALVHCEKYGYQSYQLFINTRNITKERKKHLLAYCQTHPNIIFYIETVGRWNFEIIYELENQKKFQELLIELRSKFADIIFDTEIIILSDHYVKYNQYPLQK